MSTLNPEIKAAIDAQTPDRARELLRDALKDANADTFYFASLVALDDDQRQHFLQKAVDLDPFHSQAYKDLQSLKQGSKPVVSTPAPVVNTPILNTPPVVETPPSTPSPAPAPTPNASPNQLSENNMVVATVSANDVNLRTFPLDSALPVTQLRSGSEVFLITRDDYAEWYQTVYQSQLGTKFGWVRADQVTNVNFNGEAIAIMDLPITNFELNTREEVQKLIAEMKRKASDAKPVSEKAKKYMKQAQLSYLAFFVILAITVFLAMTDATNRALGPLVNVVGGASFLSLAISGVFFFKSYQVDGPARENRARWKEQIKRYNSLQNNMRSDYEKMRDDQRRDAAIGFAANLGSSLLNTAASRYITNRQKVTVEHTHKK